MGGARLLALFDVLAALSVVDRCMFVVSAEGGGGKFRSRSEVERMAARHRKHSPVPKKCVAG